MARTKTPLDVIYQMKVTLKYTRPPIWRRIQVPGHFTLYDLHVVLQAVMGWENFHLHEFIIGKTSYRGPDPAGNWTGMQGVDETDTELREVLGRRKTKFTYEYDFGDSWEHELLVEEVLPPEEDVAYPVCLAGRRSCPPEDCGGAGGYGRILATISDPDHEEYEECLEWVGEEFDPGAFDLDEINYRLALTC